MTILTNPRLSRLLKTASRIEPNEVRAVLASFLFSFTLMAAWYILRPIRDAMSSAWTDAELSMLYTATFVCSTIAVAGYGFACARIRLGRVIPGVYVVFALSFVAFFALSRGDIDGGMLNKIFYVWVSVFSLFQVSVFWSFMSDIFSKEQATRVFGFISAGASIGAIVGPAIALLSAKALQPEELVLISAALLIIPIIVIGWLEKLKTTDLNNQGPDGGYNASVGANPFAGFTQFIKDPYLLFIGLFILLYTAISTFVYFEIKNLLAPLDEASRRAIWSGMDLAVNVLTISIAMFATGRIAARFGITTVLTMIPALVFGGLLLLSVLPLISVVVGLQIVRRAGNYAVTRPGREMLFTVVDRERRFKAKSVIDIVVYRGGDMLSGWAFTGLTQGLGLGLGALAGVGAGLALIWAAVGVQLGLRFKRQQTVDSEQDPDNSA